MYFVSYSVIIFSFFILAWMVLPNIKWFRKLIGGKWYHLRDRRDPSDSYYWSRSIDVRRSYVKEVEDYSDDTPSTT